MKSGESTKVSFRMVLEGQSEVEVVKDVRLDEAKQFVEVWMSDDGGETYFLIGKLPYPKIKGRRYKTNVSK